MKLVRYPPCSSVLSVAQSAFGGPMMLRHTFCHLPGVAAGTEQRLWSAGLTTWDHALVGEGTRKTPGRRLPADELRESVRRHGVGDAAWFAARLPAAQSWRLFADFRDHCAYLDIETTGMDARRRRHDDRAVRRQDGPHLRARPQPRRLRRRRARLPPARHLQRQVVRPAVPAPLPGLPRSTTPTSTCGTPWRASACAAG